MKQLLVLLVAVVIQGCYHYGAYSLPTSEEQAEGSAESAGEEGTDGKAKPRSGVFTSSFSSSSSGPGGVWTTMFSGPETGGKVVSFSSNGNGFSSKSESSSSSSGTNIMQSTMNMPDDFDGVFAQTGSFVSEEDDDIMPFKSRSLTSANPGVRSRLLGLGGSGSSSGLLGLGLGPL